MIRRIYRAINPVKPGPEDALIAEAHKMERYKPHEFRYNGYHLQVSDFLSVAYQIKEYFGDQRMKFDTGKKNPFIIDCGANVGISVLYFKKLFPEARIEAFEPDPDIMSYLKKNIEANHIKGVNLHQKAIWKDNNGISFGSEGADGGSIFLDNKRTIQIPTLRLRELLATNKEVDLLKIDIEGAETEVIKDCDEELRKVKYLFIEYHSWVTNKQELDVLLNILTKNGFRYYIHSIGAQTNAPFDKVDAYNGMDVQLDIYAVNTKK